MKKNQIFAWKVLFTILLYQPTFSEQLIEKSSSYVLPEITFLSQPPIVDGILDDNLQTLEIRKFDPSILKTNADSPVNNMNYRMAYGTHFFYVFINVESDSIVCRDRGFQNGDGFMLSFTMPQFNNQRPDEFYILGFYPAKALHDQFKKITWNYNNDYIFSELSNKCEFVVKTENSSVGYELLLPWSDVYPYHPWISESIGFNLFFVKAIGENDVNMHGVVIQEHIPLQDNVLFYKRLKFEVPGLARGTQSYLIMNRNCYEGEAVPVKVVTLADNSRVEKISVELVTNGGQSNYSAVLELITINGTLTKQFDLPIYDLLKGDYKLRWNSPGSTSSGDIELTVLPNLLFDNLYLDLENIRGKVSAGSYDVMQFYLEDIERRKDELKYYESCPVIRQDLEDYLALIEKMKNGQDILATKTGLFRRAYYADIDKAFRPYTIKIPVNYNPKKRYPLLVFLHGSDRDDRELAAHTDYVSDDNFIQLAPNGAGLRNCYTTRIAQMDISNAINDVISNYAIDTTNIFLAGFSMGGYGVLRTFYETPAKYTALAIFSGQPDLARHYFPGETHPNFLLQDNLKKFENVPIFIFHGEKDRNAPFHLTKELVKKLILAGAKVTYVTEKETGHSPPGRNNVTTYHRWLKNIVKN